MKSQFTSVSENMTITRERSYWRGDALITWLVIGRKDKKKKDNNLQMEICCQKFDHKIASSFLKNVGAECHIAFVASLFLELLHN